MGALIRGPLAGALANGRERYNAKFVLAKRSYPGLRGEVLGDFLGTWVAPLITTACELAPEQRDVVAEALYDVALSVVAQDTPSRCPTLARHWQQVLIRHASLLVQHAGRLAGGTANALYTLHTTPGARPHDWVALMTRLSSGAKQLDALLRAGVVAAWLSGMVDARDTALGLCEKLPRRWVAELLGLGATTPRADLQAVIATLRDRPWITPEAALGAPKGASSTPMPPSTPLAIVAVVGAFRGFGGLFTVPPLVTVTDQGFLVRSGDEAWYLRADRFGHTLERVDVAEPVPSGGWVLHPNGDVHQHRRKVASFPALAGATSFAANDTTLAVTLPFSHAVVLLARADQAAAS